MGYGSTRRYRDSDLYAYQSFGKVSREFLFISWENAVPFHKIIHLFLSKFWFSHKTNFKYTELETIIILLLLGK